VCGGEVREEPKEKLVVVDEQKLGSMEGYTLFLYVAFLHGESALRATDDQVGPIALLKGFLV
jgi:hypothetical protein